MRISVVSIFIILFFGIISFTQQPVIVQPSDALGGVRMTCADMLAGNASIIATTAGEDLLDPMDIVLCAGNGVIIGHQGDFDLTGDPDGSTPAGIWYAVFTEEPNVSGVIDQASLAELEHLVKLENGNLVFARANDDYGNMTIINDGTFLEAAGLTAPVQLWFVPVTIHNTNGTEPNEFFENTENCIHLNSESTFAITYLNELEYTIQNPGETSGTITISGGMKEYLDSDYIVTLTNLTTHESQILTSENGTDFRYENLSPDYSYRLTISDAVECSVNHIITFRSGDPLMVRIPHQTTTPGAEICVPLTVQDFNDVGTFQFVLAWNPSILAFNSVNYKNPILSANGSSLADNQEFADQGLIFFSWYTFSATAIEIPDQDTLIEVCFEAVGDPGERTEVTMGPYNSTGIDFTDIDGPINFEIENGSVTIIPSSDLDFSHSACGSGDELNLTVQIFGGRAPYSYELTGPSIQSDDDVGSNISIDNLPEGEYTLRIIDADGFDVTKTFHIENLEENYGIVPIANTCNDGNPNGMAYIDNPPLGNYQIEWTYNNQKYYNIDTLPNLAGGEVSFIITDENNCPSPIRTVTIPNNGIQATYEVLEAPGCDGTPGQVQFSISGGTMPYTILYNGNSQSFSTSNPSLEFFGTSANFQIQDAERCPINIRVESELTGGESFILRDTVVIDLNCENQEVGGNGRMGQFEGVVESNDITNPTNFRSAVLYHSDGQQVHGTSVRVNPATGQIQARFLESGGYYWIIEGSCSRDTIHFTINDLVSNPPTITESITAIGCGSENELGSISIEVFPEKSNYIYEWSHGETTASIGGLAAGEYTLTVTDPETRCSVMGTYTISEGVTYNKMETTLPCDVDTTVNVGVTIRDDYEAITWDSGETTEIIQVSSPGYYGFTITLTDPTCAPIRDSIYIRSATGGVSITGVNPVLIDDCGTPEGIFVVYLSQPIRDFGFSWDGAEPVLGQNELRVYDSDIHNLKIYQEDCIAIDTSFSFVFNNIIVFDTTTFDITCHGANDGQISVSASGGGSNNFRYEFERNGRLDFIGDYRGLGPGEYMIRVLDQTPPSGSPCPAVTLAFTIHEPDPFVVAVDSSQVTLPSCFGEQDGSIGLSVEGGNPGTMEIRYTFSGGAKRTTSLTLDSLRASNYMIRVEDSLGCVAMTNYMLGEPDPVNFEIPDIVEPECAGYTTTVVVANATGGTGMDYQFSVNGGVPVPLGESIDVLAGTLDITVYDGNLCSVTNQVIVPEPAPILVSFNQPDTIMVSLGENVEIAAQVNGENPITDYIWSPSPPDSLNIREILQFSAVQDLTIHLEAIDSRGCVGSNEIFVLVRKTRDIGIPNAFSPNGDGHNDLLTVFPGPAVRSIQKFQIFDRYGTLVWEASDIPPARAQITGWDGTYSGRPAMVDVYVMLLRVEYIDGQVIQRITDVTLIK